MADSSGRRAVILRANEVLKEIYSEKSLNIAHLSHRFGTSREAIGEVIDSLQDQGYLKAVETGGFDNGSGWLCRFCPLRGDCQTRTLGINFYRLTEEGQQTIISQDKARREKDLCRRNP